MKIDSQRILMKKVCHIDKLIKAAKKAGIKVTVNVPTMMN